MEFCEGVPENGASKAFAAAGGTHSTAEGKGGRLSGTGPEQNGTECVMGPSGLQAEARIVQLGELVVNLGAIAEAHWESDSKGRRLFVKFTGGNFGQYTGKVAERLWGLIVDTAEPIEK